MVEAEPNLKAYLSARRLWLRFGAAVLSGLLLSAAFPPLEMDDLAWVALLPLLLAPVPATPARRLGLGWIFGFAHFGTTFNWLNQVGIGLGPLMGAVCACFPAVWYWAATARRQPRATDSSPNPDHSAAGADILQALLLPAVWVALEWVRSWIFTGLPWNQLGISQWQRLGLLRLTTVTGVYGISFLIVAVNIAIWHLARRTIGRFRGQGGRRLPWSAPVVAALVAGAVVGVHSSPQLGKPSGTLQVASMQGNIPQIRQWTPEQLTHSLKVYTALSRIAAATKPDLIVWPETAVPAAILYNQEYATAFHGMMQTIRTPVLLGSLDYQTLPPETAGAEPDFLAFNSAMLFDAQARLLDSYNKTHLVPFGEYTPLERFWPWLTRWIGMGRSLTPGSEFTIFRTGKGAQAGINICFEDVFPTISRRFVLAGANLLVTLTNDAWYAESSGSRQHMVHAVFRAAENARPLLRAGNNSDTCLILPDGRVSGLLYDNASGNRFVRGFRQYSVPVYPSPGLTWYTRHGDLFAKACALVATGFFLFLAGIWLERKRRLMERIHQPAGIGAPR